jgi:hypothetical protein
MPMRLADRFEHGIAIRHVERQDQHRITINLDEFIERLRVSRRGDNLVAAFQGGLRPDTAKPARCTSDEPNL